MSFESEKNAEGMEREPARLSLEEFTEVFFTSGSDREAPAFQERCADLNVPNAGEATLIVEGYKINVNVNKENGITIMDDAESQASLAAIRELGFYGGVTNETTGQWLSGASFNPEDIAAEQRAQHTIDRVKGFANRMIGRK
ncbi:hypothetical protein K2P47_03555 [Patescibacteria group bacterium]|nr:hypothetical protein [Patescibacteria group bacterium]